MAEKNSYNETRKRAIYNYRKKMDLIRVNVSKEKKAEYAEAAAEEGKSMNRFIIDAIEEHIERKTE